MNSREVASQFLAQLYKAVESFDPEQLRRLLRPEAFVFTPAAHGVLTSADAVVLDIERASAVVAARGETLRLRSDGLVVGASPSGHCLWVFDQVVAEAIRSDEVLCSVPIRLTALLTLDEAWQLAAAYWSVPYGTQQEQDAVKLAGSLEPGVVLDELVASDARPFVEELHAALGLSALIPGLYSTRDDHVTIGSVVDEVLIGRDARAAWQEFVGHVTAFEPRGPMRAALVAPDVGWLAANIDIGTPATPYRFFYIWLREDAGWRIVVSHDAVSRDPLAMGT